MMQDGAPSTLYLSSFSLVVLYYFNHTATVIAFHNIRLKSNSFSIIFDETSADSQLKLFITSLYSSITRAKKGTANNHNTTQL